MEVMLGSLLQAEGHTEAGPGPLAEGRAAWRPRLPQIHLRLGSAYLAGRQFKQAEGAFRKVLELDSDQAEACYGLSVALMRQNKLEESVELGAARGRIAALLSRRPFSIRRSPRSIKSTGAGGLGL